MAGKNFFEIFNLYNPGVGAAGDFLLGAKNIRVRADREKRFVEVRAEFPETAKKEFIYDIEKELAKIYKLNCFRILPSYPEEAFTEAYIPEILIETERTGVVAKGFFTHYDYELNGDRLVLRIPFSEGGVGLLYDAKTPSIIAKNNLF